jgi:ribosomal protein S18 acetylase RimI-like enzyme
MTQERDFWSRRKAGVADEAAREEQLRAKAETAREVAALEERPDEEILAELALPDPETMQRGDDFAAFMQHAVPERLRQRALRQLWRSDPVLANLDGLNNYDTDFRESDIPGIAVKTSYQVGKGFARTVMKAVSETEPEPEEKTEPTPEAAPTPEALQPEQSDETAQDSEASALETEVEVNHAPVNRGRMRFAYVDLESAMEAP